MRSVGTLTPVAVADISCLEKACSTPSPAPPPRTSPPHHNLPLLLCQTRKCAQETAVPHVRLLAPGQVHPGNGAMCDRPHVADSIQGAVTVIRISMNLKGPCCLLGKHLQCLGLDVTGQ